MYDGNEQESCGAIVTPVAENNMTDLYKRKVVEADGLTPVQREQRLENRPADITDVVDPILDLDGSPDPDSM